jgi:hypothetical protein
LAVPALAGMEVPGQPDHTYEVIAFDGAKGTASSCASTAAGRLSRRALNRRRGLRPPGAEVWTAMSIAHRKEEARQRISVPGPYRCSIGSRKTVSVWRCGAKALVLPLFAGKP